MSQIIKTYLSLLSSAARTATTTVDYSTAPATLYDTSRERKTAINPFGAKCAHFILDVTSITGADTLTMTLSGLDSVSGKYYTLLAGAAVSSTGTTVYKVGVGFTPVSNLTANDFIPALWKVVFTHGTGDGVTYSFGAWLYGE